MNVKKLKKNKRGSMLVEIIMVLVTIGILMALAVPAVMKYTNEVADIKVQSQVRVGHVTAQFCATSQIGENPDVSNNDLTTKVSNTDAVNGELGLPKTGESDDARCPEGAVKSIAYVLTEKRVDKCKIQVERSNDTYTATQAEIGEATK